MKQHLFSCNSRFCHNHSPQSTVKVISTGIYMLECRLDKVEENKIRNFQIFEIFTDFRKIFRFLENFPIFGKLSDFWTIFRFADKVGTSGSKKSCFVSEIWLFEVEICVRPDVKFGLC